MPLNLRKTDKLVNAFFDCIIFALISNLIYYTIFNIIFSLPFDYFWQSLAPNLIFWFVFACLNLNKKVILFTFVAISLFSWILAYRRYDEILLFYENFIIWINTSLPNQEILLEKPFGAFLKSFAQFAVSLIMIIPYYLKKFSKFVIVFWIALSITVFYLSVHFTDIDFFNIYIFLIVLFPCILFSANFKKFNMNNEKFLFFLGKRSLVYLLIAVIFASLLQIVPLDYKSLNFYKNVNVFSEEVLDFSLNADNFSSEISSTLGGDNIQNQNVLFLYSGNSGVYLKTDIYDIYTGNSFKKSTNLKNSDRESFYSADIVDFESFNVEKFVIKMLDYESNALPVPNYFVSITSNFDFFSELKSSDYNEVTYSTTFTNEVINVVYSEYSFSYESYFSSNSQADDEFFTLPDTTSERTIELANSIKDEALTSFFTSNNLDYVENSPLSYSIIYSAFCTYLSANYEYSLTPDENFGGDFVDNFLFEHKEGYCTSFASALFVMLRAVNIPCSYVVGFALNFNENELDNDGYYTVTDSDMHAWVEVYLTKTDIIIVDPLSSEYKTYTDVNIDNDDEEESSQEEEIPEVSESPESVESTSPEATITPSPEDDNQDITDVDRNYHLIFIVCILVIIVFVILLYFKCKINKINKILNSKDTEILYNALIKLLSILKLKRKSGETVREFLIYTHKLDIFPDCDIDILLEEVESYLYAKNTLGNKYLSQCVNATNDYLRKRISKILYIIRF